MGLLTGVKLLLRAATAVLGVHARWRLIPRLSDDNLGPPGLACPRHHGPGDRFCGGWGRASLGGLGCVAQTRGAGPTVLAG
jgi:hypothetical protein